MLDGELVTDLDFWAFLWDGALDLVHAVECLIPSSVASISPMLIDNCHLALFLGSEGGCLGDCLFFAFL